MELGDAEGMSPCLQFISVNSNLLSKADMNSQLFDCWRKRLHTPSAGGDLALPLLAILALVTGSAACHKSMAYIFHTSFFHVGAPKK